MDRELTISPALSLLAPTSLCYIGSGHRQKLSDTRSIPHNLSKLRYSQANSTFQLSENMSNITEHAKLRPSRDIRCMATQISLDFSDLPEAYFTRRLSSLQIHRI